MTGRCGLVPGRVDADAVGRGAVLAASVGRGEEHAPSLAGAASQPPVGSLAPPAKLLHPQDKENQPYNKEADDHIAQKGGKITGGHAGDCNGRMRLAAREGCVLKC